jgi:allantoin racemase
VRLLLINPNTSVHITERLAASAHTALLPGETLTCLTAPTGPRAVRNAEDLAVAEASALALAAAHADSHDALVLAISLDGAAPRLRQRHPAQPVVGMTEAALLMAGLRAEHIGVLTLGADLLDLYRQRVAQIGLATRVVAYQAPEAPAAFDAGGPRVSLPLLELLAMSCTRLREAGAQSVVLAGAVLCGYAAALQLRCGLPVFDGVASAVGLARLQLQEARRAG